MKTMGRRWLVTGPNTRGRLIILGDILYVFYHRSAGPAIPGVVVCLPQSSLNTVQFSPRPSIYSIGVRSRLCWLPVAKVDRYVTSMITFQSNIPVLPALHSQLIVAT